MPCQRIPGAGTMYGFYIILAYMDSLADAAMTYNVSVTQSRDESAMRTAYSLCQGMFILTAASFFIISRICVVVRDMNQRSAAENMQLLNIKLCLMVLILCNMVIFLLNLSQVLTNSLYASV